MLLVRHGRPLQAGTEPRAWPLDADAAGAVRALALRVAGHRVVSSTERKAIDTAALLAAGPAPTDAAFDEVARPWYGDAGALGRHARRWFDGERVDGWEPLADAVARFGAGVERHLGDGRLAVVTHGTVLTAWLAVAHGLPAPADAWAALRMPDVVEVDHR